MTLANEAAERWEACLALLLDEPLLSKVRAWRAVLLRSAAGFASTARSPPLHLQLIPHVTVKYFGRHGAAAIRTIERLVRSLPAFDTVPQCTGAGQFCSSCGGANVHVRLTIEPELLHCQTACESIMREAGCPDRDRYSGNRYQPHVTVADAVNLPAMSSDVQQVFEEIEAMRGVQVRLNGAVLFRKPADAPVFPEVVTLW